MIVFRVYPFSEWFSWHNAKHILWRRQNTLYAGKTLTIILGPFYIKYCQRNPIFKETE